MGHVTLTYIYEDNIAMEKGLAVAANMTHAVDGFLVREVVRRCNYDEDKLLEVEAILYSHLDCACLATQFHPLEQLAINHKFMSLRGIEFITKDNVLEFSETYREELLTLIQETKIRPSFPVITIHDEYKCHPNYVNFMREVYMGVLAELADSTVGQQIIREVRGDDTFILDKLSTNLGDEIIKAEYFLS